MGRMLQVALLGSVGLACVGLAAPLGPGTCAEKPAPAPAKNLKKYDIRMILVGDTFQAIRFRPATGESWLANGSKWEKIPETAAAGVVAGEYDIVMSATDKDFAAIRLDRATGTSWLLKGRKWVQMGEP